jgi:hypothetical protein
VEDGRNKEKAIEKSERGLLKFNLMPKKIKQLENKTLGDRLEEINPL